MISCHKPYFVNLPPPYTKFSKLQNMNPKKNTPEWLRELEIAKTMINFSMLVARMQARSGRHFMFEHPIGATSWQLPSVTEMAMMKDVGVCSIDMCAYGLKSQDKFGEGAARKRTRLMTNCPALLECMRRQCEGGHRHVILVDGRAGPAARYTESYFQQIVKCIEAQRLSEGKDEA